MAAVGMPAICGLYFTHSPDCLGLCFVIGGIMASAAASAGRSAAGAARAGLVWSLAALTRTQYLPLGPAALLLFIYLDAGWWPASARRAQPQNFGAPLWLRALCLLAGWLIPLLTYYTLLSLDAHQATITNAYDAASTMAFYSGRPRAVAQALASSLLTGLPLLILAGLHLRVACHRLHLAGKAAGLILPWIKTAGVLDADGLPRFVATTALFPRRSLVHLDSVGRGLRRQPGGRAARWSGCLPPATSDHQYWVSGIGSRLVPYLRLAAQ